MSERTTGATDEQIEAALDKWCSFNDFRAMWHGSYSQDAQEWASALVPEGYVIARAADVLTAEQRAELMTMIRDFGNASFHVGYDSGHEMSSEEQVRISEKRRDESLAAIRANLNGGTE